MDRPRLRQRAARYAIPALLVLVALNQVRLVHTSGLSPWKGGGFGMFSTVDRPETRILRVFFRTPRGDALAVDPAFAEAQALASTFPSTGRLTAIARAQLRRGWSVVGHDALDGGALPDERWRAYFGGPAGRGYAPLLALPREASAPDTAGVPILGARVEVWRMRFLQDDGVLTGTKMAEVEVPRRP